MKALLFFLLLTTPAQARVLWEDNGFVVESGGWVEVARDWTGVTIGVTVPDDGYVLLDVGSFELYIPGVGWVTDTGTIVSSECVPRGNTRDRSLSFNSNDGCAKQGGRVMLTVQLPHMFVTRNNAPTNFRWTRKGSYHVEED